MTKLISIAAVSGGGKTTLTKQLLESLPCSAAIYFDEIEFEKAPENLTKWVDEGGDLREWGMQPLIDQIEKVLNQEDAPSYLILDYPFSYLHNEVAKYIHYSIYIDTPLDIAMARRVLRDQQCRETVSIMNELQYYLTDSRRAYLHMENTVKPSADCVLDGTKDPESLVADVLSHTKTKASFK
ncbi:AAA family ATPase [Jeotgalibacillus salarius]|nr:AAA family ATPase [Jeotgalibacillus salarius]